MISRVYRGDNENAAAKRKRQIDTLKIFNDNVVELREDVEYEVQFDAGDKRMAIIVSLPPEFPLEKPILRVSPPGMHHHWCNEHSEIIKAPGLLNFTVYSDIGRVVQAIIREFSKNPPSPLRNEVSVISNTSSHHSELQDGTLPYGLQCYPDLYSAAYNSSHYNSQYPKYSSSNPNVCQYNYINACTLNDDQAAFAAASYHPMYTNNHHQHQHQHLHHPHHHQQQQHQHHHQQQQQQQHHPHTPNSVHTMSVSNTTATTTSAITIISTTSTIDTTTITASTTVTAINTTTSNSNNQQIKYFPNCSITGYMGSTTCYNANTEYQQIVQNQALMHSIANCEFPELNNLSNEELIKLSDEDDKNLDIFLDECSRLEDIHLSIDETIDSVEEIANENLTKEIELKLLQDEITLKMETVTALKARYDNLIQQYNKLSEAFAPDHIKECLKRAADSSHEQSENIAENFLEQKIDVEHFLSSYIECRKLGQARRTKEEKLAEQLNELKRAGY